MRKWFIWPPLVMLLVNYLKVHTSICSELVSKYKGVICNIYLRYAFYIVKRKKIDNRE